MALTEPYVVLCRSLDGGEQRVAGRYRTELAASQAVGRFNTNAERFSTRWSYYVMADAKEPSDQLDGRNRR